jgi:hypothetical protein
MVVSADAIASRLAPTLERVTPVGASLLAMGPDSQPISRRHKKVLTEREYSFDDLESRLPVSFIQTFQLLLVRKTVQFEVVVERLPKPLAAEVSCMMHCMEFLVCVLFKHQRSHRIDQTEE